MKIIYKYTIDVQHGTDLTVEMPVDYNVVKTALQKRDGVENFCIWAEVETENETKGVHFRIHPTGQRFPRDHDQYQHIETVFAENKLFWHVYKKKSDRTQESRSWVCRLLMRSGADMKILFTSDLHGDLEAFKAFTRILNLDFDIGVISGDLLEDAVTLNIMKETLSVDEDDLLEELYDPDDSIEDLTERVIKYNSSPRHRNIRSAFSSWFNKFHQCRIDIYIECRSACSRNAQCFWY